MAHRRCVADRTAWNGRLTQSSARTGKVPPDPPALRPLSPSLAGGESGTMDLSQTTSSMEYTGDYEYLAQK